MTAARRAHGPYETEAAALADIETLAPSAGLDHFRGTAKVIGWRGPAVPGRYNGPFDLFILARFAHWEPDAVMVVRGLIERAYAAGQHGEPAGCSDGSEQPGPAEELVHWARQGAPLGDPAQCGAPEGRATRVASAVTCPACLAWMREESWSGHGGTEAH